MGAAEFGSGGAAGSRARQSLPQGLLCIFSVEVDLCRNDDAVVMGRC